MKKQLLYLLFAVALTSCNSSFYQIISTKSNDVSMAPNGEMIYYDDNCVVAYNLWAEKGNSGFLFTNKTDKDIFIDLSASFFIMNGIAYDYYLDRTYTSGKAISTTQKGALAVGGAIKPTFGGQHKVNTPTSVVTIDNYTVSTSTSHGTTANTSVSFKEKVVVCIPGNTSKYFREYDILKSAYRECGYNLYPKNSNVRSLTYNESNSPVKFANKISYTIGEGSAPIVLVNGFYACKITNKTEKRATINEQVTTDCDGKDFKFPVKVVKMVDESADSFYIRYGKSVNVKTKY